MSDSKERKVGAILSYVSIIASTVVGLIYTPFLILKLGQNEYGLYSLVSSIIGYLTILDLGFGNSIIVFSTKYRAQKKYNEENKLLGMFRIIYLILGVVVTFLGFIIFLNTNYLFGNTMDEYELSKIKIMLLILMFNLAVTFIFNIYTSLISSYEKFIFKKIMAILNTILKPILMIPLLFLGYKSIAMCVVITIVNLFVLISNYYFCRKKLNIKIKYSGYDKDIFREIIGYSFYIFLASIVDKINWSADNFILGMVSGTIAVSIYSVATQINTMFLNLSTAISGVLLPKMSKMVANNASDEELTEEMIKIGRIQFYIIFLMASGFVLFGKNFMISWVGVEFVDSYYVTLLLIIPVCFPLIQNLGISIMQAKNKYKFKSITTAIMAVFNIIISVFLARKFGAIGAALGTTIALVICNIIIINIYYYKVIKINIIRFWKVIAKMVIYYVIPIMIMIFFCRNIPLNGYKGFIIYGIIYTIMYLFVSYYFVMNQYEKKLINKFLIKFRR